MKHLVGKFIHLLCRFCYIQLLVCILFFWSSRKYIHTIEFKDEDYEETIASAVEEIRALGKAGWQKYDELTVSGFRCISIESQSGSAD